MGAHRDVVRGSDFQNVLDALVVDLKRELRITLADGRQQRR
jgi:hypothetical protein